MRETLQLHVEGMRTFVREQLGRLPWIMGILFVVCCAGGYALASFLDKLDRTTGRGAD